MINRSKVLIAWFVVCLVVVIAIVALVLFLKPEYITNF